MPAEKVGSEIRVRVRDPKKFQQDSFRRITFKKAEGIDAVIGRLTGKTTTTVQSLRFKVDKGWTVAKADKWYKDHKKELNDWASSIDLSLFDAESNWECEDGNVKFIVELSDDLELADNVTKGARVLYFSGKGQSYKHWMGEFKLDGKVFLDFVTNFRKKVVGRDLFVNYNHERTVAAGWYKDLYLADKDGTRLSDTELSEIDLKNGKNNILCADIEWTPKALEAIKDKEYRYFSSEFTLGKYRNNENGKEAENVYTGGALTNNPFMRKTNVELEDIYLDEEEKIMPTKQEMFVTLRDEYEIDVEKALADAARVEEVEKLLSDEQAKSKDLQAQLDKIQETAEADKVEAILADLQKDGKSTKDLNDNVYRPYFLSIGSEKAKEVASGLQVIVKLEAGGSQVNTSEDGKDLNESERVDQKVKQLQAENKDLSYEEALDRVLADEEEEKEGE